tara:strand:- start:6610 stop:7806 length:1197 start_codon:yes stop_codon:yes gene_type:complete
MNNTWRFSGKELEYIQKVLDSGLGSGTTGNMNKLFEEEFCKKIGAKYAIAMNSGTSTLHAALHALDVNAGDEVIIPPLTVISNLAVIVAQNAIPVFADVDPDTFNIDPKDLKSKITEKTKAIMPVSLYGLSCDLDPIMEIAREHKIGVINDAAEAFGSLYKGKPIAQIADITSYSLENSKHITCGEGGVVVTNYEDIAIKLRKYGSLGYAVVKSKDGRVRKNKDFFQNPQYKRHDSLGQNYRMPEVAAAMALAQAEKLEEFIQKRIDTANLYLEAIGDCNYLIPQKTPKGYNNTYWTFTLKYENTKVLWVDFRKKYVEMGGDGIYAAWALLYHETIMQSEAYKKHCPVYYNDLEYPDGICPNAEEIQPKLMQFVTNYGNLKEAKSKADALRRTIDFFA